MKVLSIKLPSPLDRRLAALVKRRGMGKSEIVREALVQYLASAPEARKGSVVELAGELVGCVKDAPADLSSNPRHLADFGR
jgi:metal-responsive CopG/Arc/MetJ family transcriptional regulator